MRFGIHRLFLINVLIRAKIGENIYKKTSQFNLKENMFFAFSSWLIEINNGIYYNETILLNMMTATIKFTLEIKKKNRKLMIKYVE